MNFWHNSYYYSSICLVNVKNCLSCLPGSTLVSNNNLYKRQVFYTIKN